MHVADVPFPREVRQCPLRLQIASQSTHPYFADNNQPSQSTKGADSMHLQDLFSILTTTTTTTTTTPRSHRIGRNFLTEENKNRNNIS
jgi:hypothetical protein